MAKYTDFVKEVEEAIAPHIKVEFDAHRFACIFVEEGDFSRDTLHIELAARHAAKGAPIPFSFDIPAELQETTE